MKATALTFALLCAFGFAHADDLRSQLDASNKAITSAMKKKDAAALTKAMKDGVTADFKYTEAGKSQTFAQMLENMKMGLAMIDKITVCEAKILTLKQKGNTATGTVEHKMVGTVKGPDKKVHSMSFTGVSANTFVKQGNKWKMASMTWKSQKQTMDGKPAPNMGH